MLRRFLEHLLAVLEAEQRRRLLRVADHGNDHFVEMPGRAFDDVEVPEGHRIERSRAESDRHAVSPVELRNQACQVTNQASQVIEARNVKSVSPKLRSHVFESPGGTMTGWRRGR